MDAPAGTDDGRHRILILGGGFAGVYTAKFLASGLRRAERARVEITIVSNENYMVFQPLLPEVVSGTIEMLHVITPIRRMARAAQLYTREIEAIDVRRKRVRLAPGFVPRPMELEYDELVVCLGTQLNFDLVPGMREHALPFKYLGDALRLRNDAVHVLEEADIEQDPEEKRKLLTFVVAGGGFSGVECMAELHDFLHSAVRAYENIAPEELNCILVQSGQRILPELQEQLALYAQRILTKRGIDLRLNTRMTAVSADAVIVTDKTTQAQTVIPTRTMITTVPAKPHPLVAALPVEHEGGRIRVTEFLNVPEMSDIWAVGDCAAVPQKDGIFSPPTAQHALRQARTCADNILARMRGEAMQSFAFTGLGSLASLGSRSAVAEVMGVRLRGFVAWVAWRAIYLMKFPGLDRQIRIAVDWTLDFILPRDITQLRIFQPDPIHNEHFHAGELVFDDGDFGDKLYVILEGEADIEKDGTVLTTLGQEEVFGEAALISDRPRGAAVRARTALDVLSVSRPSFQKLIGHMPGTRASIEEIMIERGMDPRQMDAIEEAAE
ncbi:MAG TPA: FAD-dependent oxidoreductase [Pseudomonadales bacterium]|nr:FAD-dependent oxidoreductase [Pseudomonadales bacterium]